MDIAAVAAIVYLVATVITVGFQFALALGAPWGEYTMGGAFPGRLPPKMRLLAVAQAVVLSLLALVVLSRAGVIAPELTADRSWLIWVVVAIAVLSLIMNAASPSPHERRLWVPVILVILGSSVVVALTAG